MFTIAFRELRSLFLSPLAWSILAFVQLLLGWFFAWRVQVFMQPAVQQQLAKLETPQGLTDVAAGGLYVMLVMLLLLIVPLLTMRLFSEEKRNGTLPLLLSAPQSVAGIVLGKYIGVLLFLLLLIALITLMPLSLLVGGALDWGQMASALIGVGLVVAAFAAIGLYCSLLTAQPAVAAVSSLGICSFLWLLEGYSDTSAEGSEILRWLALTPHYQALLQGLFNTADVVYFLLIIGLCLLFSIQRLDSERQR